MQTALHQELDHKETTRYAYLVLELHYFQSYLRPRTPAAIYDDLLHVSRASYYRSLNFSIQQLGKALLSRLQPTLRSEQPVLPPDLVGYTTQFEQCQSALKTGQRVSLIGPSGVGKTTLATAVTQALPAQPLFWFTFHNTINDHLDSLLMALGHFLAEQGATNTWQFLLATGGRIENYHIATALVQQDLEAICARVPILCFDEFDRLHSEDPDHLNLAHMQLLAFIESIYQSSAVLLVGQRALLAGNITIQLTGLPAPQVQKLLANAGLKLPPDEISQLTNYTQGNPRLLLLFVALHNQGESATTTLSTLPRSAELGPILGRLWKRLGANERQLLQQLAVFRSYAPLDSWGRAEVELQSLLDLRLLQQDGRGGVQILPILRDWVYHEMPQVQREQHHLAAAYIRQRLAEYTAAAYHFKQANYAEQAIQAWYPQQDWEIQRGQAEAARLIFLHLSPRGLSSAEQDALREICGRLYDLRGENETGLAVVEEQKFNNEPSTPQSEAKVRLKILRGRFLQALGHPHTAIESYEDAINLAARLLKQTSSTRHYLGSLYRDQREFTKAWQEARLMEYDLYTLHGKLHNETGYYTEANVAYQRALKIAQELADEQRVAQIQVELTILLGHQSRIEDALEYAQAALTYYERIKDVSEIATIYVNIAASYTNAGNHRAAIEPARKSLTHCQQAKDPYGVAIAAANLAECYFEIGDSTQAEQFAYQAIDQEEAHVFPYAYYTLGRVRRRAEQHQQAKDYFGEAIRIAQRNQDPFIESYLWQELGRVHLDLDEQVQARNTLRKAVRLFEQLNIASKVAETRALFGDACDVS